MAHELHVTYDGKPCYDILIRNDFGELAIALNLLSEQNPMRKICIVTDSNVAELYLGALRDQLLASFPTVTTFSFPAGEASKNLSTVETLYAELIRHKFNRGDLLIALGGGVVGDLTGFVASTYLRGIDFVQIPTTLLSQVDSSIGGKTGVDFQQYKNMVGAFYMPKLVYINTAVLSTLPDREFSSGMAEVVKHGLIRNKIYYKWLRDHISEINAKKPEILEVMIFESCTVKKLVVEHDPTEQGERAVLNFGHTIGHAIEKLSDFTMLHGECVALGAMCAAHISLKRNQLSVEDYMHIVDTFVEFGLPSHIDRKYEVDAIVEATKHDKKSLSGDKIKFITLHGVGAAFIDTDVTDLEMADAIVGLQ